MNRGLTFLILFVAAWTFLLLLPWVMALLTYYNTWVFQVVQP